MKKLPIPTSIACLTIVCFSLFSCTIQQKQEAKPLALKVSAAISLKDALADIKELYSKEKPNVTLTYNLGGSGELAKKIEEGEAVDIFISAAPKAMNDLQKKGKILPETRQDLLSNKVVLVANKDLKITNFKDLINETVKTISLGDKTVPVGQYSEEVLKSIGIFEEIKPKVIFAKNVREVLSNVETGKADAGIVYMTDALQSLKVKVAAIAPENSHKPINYPAAVLKDSKNIPEAKEFVTFLASDRGGAIFVKYGFNVKVNQPTTSK